MANLASTYTNQGRWEEAEQLEVRATETRKTKIGENYPDTLISMADLGFTWEFLAHDADVINFLRGCLTKQKQRIGLNHPITLSYTET
jgi:hypothetical protein